MEQTPTKNEKKTPTALHTVGTISSTITNQTTCPPLKRTPTYTIHTTICITYMLLLIVRAKIATIKWPCRGLNWCDHFLVNVLKSITYFVTHIRQNATITSVCLLHEIVTVRIIELTTVLIVTRDTPVHVHLLCLRKSYTIFLCASYSCTRIVFYFCFYTCKCLFI